MKCRFCNWLCDRFCPPDTRDYWSLVYRWEEKYASQWEPWDENDDRRTRASEAGRMVSALPQEALIALTELADNGSAYAMRWVAVLYGGGYGVARDDAAAEEYYRQALCAGSWMATLGYAKRLYARGAHDGWPNTLGDGVASGFVPAMFWLAWYRYQLHPTRMTAKAVRALLDDAARAGHPGATLVLARWTSQGKFGLRHIPRGFRMIRSVIAEMRGQGAPAIA